MNSELKNLIDEYKNWLLPQIENIKTDSEQMSSGGEVINLRTDFATGQIKFHEFNFKGQDIVVVELLLTNSANDENEFYLHFELRDLNRAKELFKDMLETLKDLKNRQTLKILLCCTSALTTSYFKEKLNEAANLLQLNMEFNAVSFYDLYKVGYDYSVILLAPQISYEFNNVSKVLHDQLVLKVPPKIFARYDVTQMIEVIRTELDQRKKSKEELTFSKAVGNIDTDKKILSIAILRSFNKRARIAYRIYEHGTPIFSEMVIKEKLDLVRDLHDIIETVSVMHNSSFDAVGIAVAGSVHDGHLDLPNYIDIRVNLKQMLEETFDVPIVITNDVRSAAIGYYYQQEKFKNIVFLSQPRGSLIGGQAVVIDGKLVQGAHNISGEIRYLSPHEHLGITDSMDLDAILGIIAKEIAYGICVVDPEVICIRAELFPDVDKIRSELEKLIPAEYLPELVHIPESQQQELILFGQMILTIKECNL